MSPQVDEPVWRLALRALIRLALMVAILFVPAGRLDWPRGWFFLGLSMATVAVTIPVFRRENPRILRTRLQKTKGTKAFDKVILAILMTCMLACLAIAGFNIRFHWSSLAFEWTYLGVFLYVVGYIPVGLVLATNPFAEMTVRIQKERDHVTIATGPYRVVRHPMYVGLLVVTGSWPLLLDSIWSYVPWALFAVTIIVRTALEDQTLRRELPGYEEYTRHTRYRLIPEVW